MQAGTKFKTIDEYIATFPADTQTVLQQVRATVKQAAPQGLEVISYNMPAIKQKGILVYYAGYKGHIGFYPTPSAMRAFKDELDGYETSKGAIKFPLDKPIDFGLIARITKFRLQEVIEKETILSNQPDSI